MTIVSATIWLVLTALGFGLLRALPHVGSTLLKAALVRVAAFAFIGAGVIGASGFLGDWLHRGMTWLNTHGSYAMLAAVGSGAIWIFYVGLSIVWLLGILPHRHYAWQIPDWLSVTGLVLPALAVGIPGPIGDFFRGLYGNIGDLMVQGANAAIGRAA